MTGHGNGGGYLYKMLKRTFWSIIAAVFAIMLGGAGFGLLKDGQVPYWVGTAFWTTLCTGSALFLVSLFFNR